MRRDGRIDELRAMMRQLDDAMREAEAVRSHLDRARTREPFWPDRRAPKRWERESTTAADREPTHEQITGSGEPKLVDE